METGDSYEDVYFHNIPKVVSVAHNQTPGGNEVMAFNPACRMVRNANSVGANCFMEVMPGDELNVSMWAAYESGSSYANTINTATMINLVAASYTGITEVLADAQVVHNTISGAVGKENRF